MKIPGILLVTLCVVLPAHAEVFVATGTKGTLDVEYVYEAVEKGGDANNNSEWRVQRVVKFDVQLSAAAPVPLPGLHTMNAAEQGELASKSASATDSAQKAQQEMAPMMADIESIMAKCGEDEACIEQAAIDYGMAMGMTPEVESAQQDVADVVMAGELGAPRYQVWNPTAETGTYSILETINNAHRDPICMELAGGTCTIQIARKGGGDLASPANSGMPGGLSAVEVDIEKGTMAIRLPVPAGALSYEQTVVTDEPGAESGTTTELMIWPPRGMDHKEVTDALNGVVIVALNGDGREQSGEKVIKLAGEAEESGTLRIRWQFKAP